MISATEANIRSSINKENLFKKRIESYELEHGLLIKQVENYINHAIEKGKYNIDLILPTHIINYLRLKGFHISKDGNSDRYFITWE